MDILNKDEFIDSLGKPIINVVIENNIMTVTFDDGTSVSTDYMFTSAASLIAAHYDILDGKWIGND